MHTPQKRFGQNFLVDTHVVDQIVAAIAPKPMDHLVEIGPGLGALTTPLLPLCQHYDAVELDRELLTPLQNRFSHQAHFHLHSADALTFDFAQLHPAPLRVIGNLPYNVASQILIHLMDFKPWIQDIFVMLQQEMAERIIAEPNTKEYGRLSVMLQYHCQVMPLFTVQNTAFRPVPKVTSMVIQLTPTKRDTTVDLMCFSALVKQAFSQRRKTIANTLKPYFNKAQLLGLGFDPQLRAENLTVEDYMKLTVNVVVNNASKH